MELWIDMHMIYTVTHIDALFEMMNDFKLILAVIIPDQFRNATACVQPTQRSIFRSYSLIGRFLRFSFRFVFLYSIGPMRLVTFTTKTT